MSEIDLYNLLKRIPEVTNAEAKEAVANVVSSKDVVTKADLKAAIAELETRITWKLIVFGVAIVGLIKYLPA